LFVADVWAGRLLLILQMLLLRINLGGAEVLAVVNEYQLFVLVLSF